MSPLLDEPQIAQRILDHIDNETTDVSDGTWCEPVANYRSQARLDAELERVFRRVPTAFCPSVALAKPGAFIARDAGGVPLLAVRGPDGVVRAFRNACRHRGAQVACGAGGKASFVCRYHGWTYGLDGRLVHVPHEYGFPGLDKDARGLVPVQAFEHGGVVFIAQDGPASLDRAMLPDRLIPEGFQLVSMNEQETHAHWKIVAEGFLEGYHIRSTHRETFYPVQFDNLNVIERFGRNSRITFPYRNIQKLRGGDPTERQVGGTLTFVYHLFPNVIIATFPKRMVLSVLEPISLERTRTVNYTLAPPRILSEDREGLAHDTDFVTAGTQEDREVVQSIQAGIASGANDFFEFGRFEGAIGHFHRNLHELVGEVG